MIDIHPPGLTLRDYFAAAALQSIWPMMPLSLSAAETTAWAARTSYEMADEMLKARAK